MLIQILPELGNHTVAILNCTEDYEDLAESPVKISDDVRMIKSMESNGF